MDSLPVRGLIAVALICAACAKPTKPDVAPRPPVQPDAPGSAASREPEPPPKPAGAIVIGHVTTLSGPIASFGIAADQGARLAVEERNAKGGIKGRTIELVSVDDAGKPAEAPKLVKRLVNENKVIAVIGGIASSTTLASAPIAQSAMVPFVTPAATNPAVTEVGDYIFRTCFMDDFQGWANAKFARDNLKATKAAVLYDQSQAYATGLADIFSRAFKELGGTIVAKEAYTGGNLDINAQLAAIKKSGAQLVYLPGYYSDAGTILRKARERGIKVPLLGGDGWESEDLPKIAGAALDGNFYSTHFSVGDERPESMRFVTSYTQKYGMQPDSIAALAYDSAHLLFDALERAPSTTGKDVRETLAATSAFSGVTGPFRFDANRNAQRSAVIVTYKDGKQVVVARIARP